MLASNKIIGFVPTTDSKQARKFYEGVLGLEFVSDDSFAMVLRSKDTMIRVAKVESFEPACYTILGWQVQEIERVASGLKERGAVFERFPWMQQDELGIWAAPGGDKVAWFKDPDGNVLSISEHV